MKHYDFSLSPNPREGNFGILSIAGSSGIAASIVLNLKVRVTPHEGASMDDDLELLAAAMKQDEYFEGVN